MFIPFRWRWPLRTRRHAADVFAGRVRWVRGRVWPARIAEPYSAATACWLAAASASAVRASSVLASSCSVASSSFDGVGHPEDFRPALEGAVAGDLVVLDRLGGRDQTGVERRRALVLGEDFLALLDDAVDRRAGLALGALADDLEHLLQAFDLNLGLALVVLEGLLSARATARPAPSWAAPSGSCARRSRCP